jgi:hypothetical protein
MICSTVYKKEENKDFVITLKGVIRHTQDSFADAFRNEAGIISGFSHDGLTALFEHLNDIWELVEIELDINTITDIKKAFAEYETATAAAINCGWTGCTLDTTENEQEEANALEWLEQQTTVITFNNGLIIQRF